MSVQKINDKKAAKHQMFLDAATKIFSERGFQETKVVDIVNEVKSGQGTFYYHFKDKQAIFDELMVGFIDRLTAVLTQNDAAAEGRLALASREMSINNARAIARAFSEDIALAKLFFRESRYVSGAGMERLEMFYSLLYWQIEDGLRKGIANGMLRRDIDPFTVARCMVGAVERVIYEALRAGRTDDLDTLVVQIVDFQMIGTLAVRE